VTHGRYLAGVRNALLETLGRLIEPGTRCALVDFPKHANVGDSAIWLGERKLLRDLGADLVYVCDLATFAEEDLKRLLPTGTILLHGGGNLGDLWPHHQRFREQVIATFPGHRIIQFPQSMHFGDRANLDRARKVLNRHPDLTLLLRDRRSLRAARAAFHVPSVLCPDSALALTGLPLPTRRSHHVLWLSRTDHERADHIEPPSRSTVFRTDWTAGEGGSAGWAARMDTAKAAMTAAAAGLRRTATSRSVAALARTYDQHAELHLHRGCRLLGSAQAVVTDRLHAHLLCLLLGQPHVLLDDRNGKVSGYARTWRHDLRPVPTVDQALGAVERLATSAAALPRSERFG
jgi:exopolysaccharide biosynthesis predicted pyruvyltransferase EpsI